jgi:hypothetical protein
MFDVTHILARIESGDPIAADPLLPLVYGELRFFAGLSGDQAAWILGISPKTADRYWVYARPWLRREMERRRSRTNYFGK